MGTWNLFRQLLCSVSFQQMQIFNQNVVLVKWHPFTVRLKHIISLLSI